MLAKVIIENGVKKIQALTADTGTGAPVGSLIAMYKKSSPSGYLYCDGSTFDETKYPALYQYLGSNVLPDYREFALVGAEENTTDVYNASTNPNGTIHDHDVYTEGQAKDDQLQEHTHGLPRYSTPDGPNDTWSAFTAGGSPLTILKLGGTTSSDNGRHGTVTRGKRKAVYFYIKATSGLTENQQENVLNTINENLSYSTTEHKTGKKWIDGKPIYSKTLELTMPSSSSTGAIADLSGLNIDMVVNMIAVIFNSTNDFVVLNGSYSFSTDFITFFIRKTDGILYYSRINATFVLGAPLKFTVEYTKTTD